MVLPNLTEYIARSVLESNNIESWERLDLGELLVIALEHGAIEEFDMTNEEYLSIKNALDGWAKNLDGLQEKIDELKQEYEDDIDDYRESLNDAINN